MEEWMDHLRNRLGDWPFRGPEPYDPSEEIEADARRRPEQDANSRFR